MTDYTENGLSVHWDGLHEHDAPADRPGIRTRLFVKARPANASNAVRLIYSIDGGPERMIRGYRVQTNPLADDQVFAIDLPSVPAGSLMTSRPVLSCSGREADPQRGGVPPDIYEAPATPGSPKTLHETEEPTRRFGFDMTYLARVTAPLERHPRSVGETPDGLQIVFPLGAQGTVHGPRLNGNIVHDGGDWMRVRRDGIGISNIRVLVQTDSGDTVMGEYQGVVDFGRDGYEALASGGGPKRAAVQLAPRYLTAAPRLQWLNRLQCVGLGRVTMATLLVEYDLYALRSYADDERKADR